MLFLTNCLYKVYCYYCSPIFNFDVLQRKLMYKPWGVCTIENKPLKYHNLYSTSACMLECRQGLFYLGALFYFSSSVLLKVNHAKELAFYPVLL